jgi:protein gp37
MGDKTAIEWSDATWNPVTGCTKISPGCKFCYAERITERWGQDFGEIILHPDRLDQPLHWKKPRRIFVNSMSDLFHEEIPERFIAACLGVMGVARQHDFQILTKRPERMLEIMNRLTLAECWLAASLILEDGDFEHWRNQSDEKAYQWPFPNVHLGVSCEDQQRADERIPWLLKTPAAVRFVSLEPLLSGIDISKYLYPLGTIVCERVGNEYPLQKSGWFRGLDWVIVGGESGGPLVRRLVEQCLGCDDCERGNHPFYISSCAKTGWLPKAHAIGWVRSIRDQCVAAGVPFFFKQWGGVTPKSGGRMLDGRTWDEYPQVHDTERRSA